MEAHNNKQLFTVVINMTKTFKGKAFKANKSKTLPKKDGFSKNNRFIQRSRQMEKVKNTVNRFDKKTVDQLSMNVDLLPAEKEDTSCFYEQLIDQCNSSFKGIRS